MRGVLLGIAVAMTALAGCAVPDASPEAQPVEGRATTIVNETFELSITESRTPTSTRAGGTNCVSMNDDRAILRGTVDVTWTPQTPLADRMSFYGGEAGPHIFLAVEDEPSPIHGEFANVSDEVPDWDQFNFFLQIPQVGVTFEQAFTLQIWLEVEGDGVLDLVVGACGMA